MDSVFKTQETLKNIISNKKRMDAILKIVQIVGLSIFALASILRLLLYLITKGAITIN